MAVRFAILGCGKAAERLALPQLTADRTARIVALVDPNRQRARRLAKLFGLPDHVVWADHRRMFDRVEVDAIGVCVPNDLHAELAIAAFQARKHVIVEKPMALTLPQADAMIAAAQRSKRFLMVEQTQRFDPAHQVAHALLQQHTLGRLSFLSGRLGHAGPEYWSGTRRSWFVDKRRSGGGALMDLGAHLIDLLGWLSGNVVARICCQTKTLRKPVPVEDHASALLEFTDGTAGSFEVSWTTRPYEVSTRFYGERGMLRTRIGDAHPVVLERCVRRGDPNHRLGKPLYPAVSSPRRPQGAYTEFVSCIRSGRAPSIPGEDARRTLQVIEAAYESARSGKWVAMREGQG